MYTLGNELNLVKDEELLAMVNGYIQFARNYSLEKWGRYGTCYRVIDSAKENSYHTCYY